MPLPKVTPGPTQALVGFGSRPEGTDLVLGKASSGVAFLELDQDPYGLVELPLAGAGAAGIAAAVPGDRDDAWQDAIVVEGGLEESFEVGQLAGKFATELGQGFLAHAWLFIIHNSQCQALFWTLGVKKLDFPLWAKRPGLNLG